MLEQEHKDIITILSAMAKDGNRDNQVLITGNFIVWVYSGLVKLGKDTTEIKKIQLEWEETMELHNAGINVEKSLTTINGKTLIIAVREKMINKELIEKI